jgi:signal transduction histidine kinase
LSRISHYALLSPDVPEELVLRLRAMAPDLHAQRLDKLPEAACEIRERPQDSLWLRGPGIDAEQMGILRTLRALAPELRIFVLLELGASLPLELRSIQVEPCPWPLSAVELRERLFGTSAARPPHAWLAGLADLLSNPLAAVSGRVQLIQILQGENDSLDPQLRSALDSLGQLEDSLRLLRRIGSPPRPRWHATDARAIAARTLLRLDPQRVRVAEPQGEPLLLRSDEELLEECCHAFGRLILGLAPPPDLLRVEAEGKLLRLRLDEPGLPLTVPRADFFAPFALDKVSHTPGLGLLPVLAQTLAEQLEIEVHVDQDDALFRGIELRLPTRSMERND